MRGRDGRENHIIYIGRYQHYSCNAFGDTDAGLYETGAAHRQATMAPVELPTNCLVMNNMRNQHVNRPEAGPKQDASAAVLKSQIRTPDEAHTLRQGQLDKAGGY